MMFVINDKHMNLIGVLVLLFATSSLIYGQNEKKFIRDGNGKYSDGKYSESEVSYRKAIDQNKASTDAGFNLGDALYKQKKFEDAGKQFLDNSNLLTDTRKKSNSYYNLGNSLLNGNKIEESIQAYKNSLKLNPSNPEAKYNLAYAQDLLQKQQQQQQKDQENKKDQDKKDDQKKNEQDKSQDKNQNKDQQQKQQEQQQGISKEDAQRLLDAIANDEKNVQEKVKLEKAAKEKVRTRINW